MLLNATTNEEAIFIDTFQHPLPTENKCQKNLFKDQDHRLLHLPLNSHS